MFKYIAEISTGDQRNGIDDITGLFNRLFFPIIGDICNFEREN